MTPFEKAYNDVAELVQKFDEHKDQFMAHKYQEAHVRSEFIDKFWTALGWDVRHEFQTNPREQEVKIEKSDTAGSTRRVDYAFRIKPDYKDAVFFCEAKKPSVDLANADDYFQLVRYGYGAGTPVGVLTNFDEFHIIDCRYQPHIEKSYPSAQIKVFGYRDYLDREAFGFIYWLFAREAIEAGKLNDYAKTLPKQRGTGKTKLTAEEARPVDEAFLIKLEEYRLTLAKAFKKADETLTAEVLTEATQKVIDRLVFIRFLEDKYIEADYIVDQIAATPPPMSEAKRRGLGGGRTSWQKFLAWSKELDVKYNGVVFKPHDIDKSSFAPPDDKVFSELCTDISHSHSKYLFTYIPVELLGSIYERFLGKVVTTTAKRADIEDKPEVRKAGGVYYTPKYIVDYIVANTVGKILNGDGAAVGALHAEEESRGGRPLRRPLKPEEISKLRFADIACGSGSFLIAVYDTVLHHVEKYYNDHPDEARKAKCTEIEKGIFVLSLKQKQQILLDNIYGVDIDRQAVEVAQLSLFLKLLESESGATAEQLSFERTKILPDLSKNIQCGNSLVEYDISDLFPLTDEEEKRIKPFSFQTAFREIMANGGFDAIVGNPPYLYSAGKDHAKYFETRFKLIQTQADYYVYFIERALGFLKEAGEFGYIVSDAWLNSENYFILRNHVLSSHRINDILIFDYPVFSAATLENSVLILTKGQPPRAIPIHLAHNPTEIVSLGDIDPQTSILDSIINPRQSREAKKLIVKMETESKPIEDYLRVNRGIHAYRTDGYGQSKFGKVPQTKKDKELQSYHSDVKLDDTYLPEVKGKDVFRYHYEWGGKFLSYGPWLAESREPAYFLGPKIALRKIISNKIHGTIITEAAALDQSLYILISENQDVKVLKYFLGILCSSLCAWYIRTKYAIYDTLYPWYTRKQLANFPVRVIDQDRMISLVDQMLTTKQRMASTTWETEREQLQNKCDYLDGEIDRLVYELYGLTAEEIRIVEGAS